MKNIVRRFATRVAALAVLLALVAWMVFPTGAFAKKQFADDHGGREGDPIDGNDFSSGGSGGGNDFFHQDYSTYSGGLLGVPIAGDGIRIVLVPRIDAGIFNVQFLMVREAAGRVEATHAE